MLLKKSTLLPNKTITISGSKSISNRLLILEKLFDNIRISNLSNAEDSILLQKALQENEEIVDIHHAGTAMRFLTSYFSISEGKTTILTGSDRMKNRPIKELVDALKDLGAEIEYLEKDGFPPLKIVGKKLLKSKVTISAKISSQFITSLMLIGAKLENGLELNLEGKITSLPYLEMTSKILRDIGIDVIWEENTITISRKKEETNNRLVHYQVESDWSSASYYYSLCAIGKENITLKSFKNYSIQGDSRLKEIFYQNFGINTITDSGANEISLLFSNPLFEYPEKIELDLNDCPDIAQTLCVTASVLKIPFCFTGLETLKIKETDRLLALKNELIKMGCICEITENSIFSVEFCEAQDNISIATYNDHRMAMSFAPFCLINELNIENEAVVEKSYPDFWEDLKTIVAEK
jgi:3-phosphoshikimate 1-carboxyvinyltransferase